MADHLVEFWRTNKEENVFRPWANETIAESILNHSGILDNTPMLETVKRVLDDKGIKRKIIVGSDDVNTGEYMTFSEDYEPADQFYRTLVASASVPFIFPHQVLPGGHVMMDGGMVYNTNLIGAAARCLEEVDDDSQIIMDVMMCSHMSNTTDHYKDTGSAYGNFMRNWDIQSHHN